MKTVAEKSAVDIESLVAEVADRFTDEVKQGRSPSIEEYAQRYPEIAHIIRQLFPTLAMLDDLSAPVPNDATTSLSNSAEADGHVAGVLGDFRILRELGRGGMGVVYETEQISLGRRVALKVLPFAAMLDKQQLARFKNEARAAATLDHPNIVAIHSVGVERGVHYYAMQLVEGRSLAEVIAAMKPGRPPSLVDATLSHPLPPGEGRGEGVFSFNHSTAGDTVKAALPTVHAKGSAPFSAPHAPSSSLPAFSSCEYFRAVAQLGIQAAEALDAAHQSGILHRDIKPANLMLDDAGKLWITDFGLARIEADAALTMTGDLLGTLRYMSPEQGMANRVVVDHRSDIYSLGVTLYELLTLRPVYTAENRHELLRQIAFDEPRKPRQFNPRIPQDLETIVLKAIEKNPADRYATAKFFADDLRRFIANEPIKARPATVRQRAAKWSRRHVGALWTMLLGSLFTAVFFGIGAVLIAKSRNDANLQRVAATTEKDKAIDQRNLAVEERNKARLNQYYADIVSGQSDWEHKNVSSLRSKLMEQLPTLGEPDHRAWEWYYLLSLCHPEVRTLRNDYRLVYAACSPDGNYIGAGGIIWKSDSGERVRSFELSRTLEFRAAWSPDGQKYAWGMDKALYVWDRTTDTVDRFAGHTGSVWSIAWSPDGMQIATGSIDHSAKIWDVETKSTVRTIPAGMNVMSVAWSPDSKLLVAGVHYTGIKIWDLATGEVLADLPESHEFHSVSWHPEGKLLGVVEDGRWYLLDRANWHLKVEHPLSRGGRAIACSPDGKQIAVAHGETITIWDAEGMQQIAELNGHRMSVNSVAWAGDSRHLVTSSNDGEIKLWDLKSQIQPPVISLDSTVDRLDWLPDNKTLVAVNKKEGSDCFWNISDSTLKKHTISVEKPVCISASRRLAAQLAASQRAIKILDIASGDTRSVLRLRPEYKLRSCEFSPDESKLALITAHEHKFVLDFWDIDTEHQISSWNFEGVSGTYLEQLTWVKDGSRVALIGLGDVGDDGTPYWAGHLHVIDVRDGKRVLKHRASGEVRSAIDCLAWSPDGKFVALGTPQGRVEVVELKSRQAVFSTKVQNSGIHAIAWHPDGKRLACGSNDGSVTLITSSGGQPLLTYSLADKSGTTVAWSADGKRLAAVTKGGSAQVWDASRGFEFTADGRRRAELARAYYVQAGTHSGESMTLDLQMMLALAPDTLDFWNGRGWAFARLGAFNHAAEEFSKTISANPRYSFIVAIDQALCRLATGDLDRYRTVCASLVELVRDSPVPSNKGHVAWLCSLAPNAPVNSKDLIAFADQNSAVDNDSDDQDLLTFGATRFRDRHLDEAVRILTDLSIKLDRGGDTIDQYELACCRYFLALARHELGQDFQARRLQALADRASDEYQQISPDWREKVILNALRREVETKLGKRDKG